MRDDKSRTEGCDVPRTKEFNMTAVKGAKRSAAASGSTTFGDADGAGPCAAPRGRTPAAKTELADQIGLRLRIVYDDVLTQPVPDRFYELLRQLEGVPGAAKRNGL
jgi:hypothetical protein